MSYAGFWKRFFATIIDTIAFYILIFLGYFIDGLILALSDNDIYTSSTSQFQEVLIISFFYWIYNTIMESSPNQGTLGKMAMGIKVTDINGERINFMQATKRHLASYFSFAIFFIGYLMVAFTEKKQGLHDILTECLVVNNN